MSFEISISSDIKRLERYMDNLEKKQLPFATHTSLNKLALKAQETICKAIPNIFNNTKKWWDKRQKTGIRVEFANKYTLSSSVYTKAYFAVLQEEGGIKKPYAGQHIAIPTANVPRRQRSSHKLKEQQANNQIFKSISGKSIYKRLAGGHLQRLYALSTQAHIKPRFGFKRIAINIFNKQFDKIFTKQFNFALSIAK